MKHLPAAPHIKLIPLLADNSPAETPTNTFDVLIVGSGLAGLSTALKLLESQEAGIAQFRIAILTKGSLADGASGWAQGGIAAVLEHGEDGDSFAAHIGDTRVAGAWLSDEAATKQVVEGAPAAIAWLQARRSARVLAVS